MILGITGAIGCGKSAVLAAFQCRNWHTADADQLCHEMYDGHDSELISRLVERWGKELLLPDGRIDRKRLGEIVFRDVLELEVLMTMLYPSLLARLTQEISVCRGKGVDAVFELPLLYEGKFESLFDAVLCVWSSPEIRRRRLVENRGFSEAEISRRETRQLSPDFKLERADYAFINNGSRKELNAQIDLWIKNKK